MPLSVASSSASSSSSESDLDSGDQAEHNRKRNSELIVKHFRQAQAKARTSPGSKVWQKLDNAIVDARLALLEVSWSGLLKALKTIEDGLQQAHFGSKLEWRIPVLCISNHAILE